jgi:hypothetical protein
MASRKGRIVRYRGRKLALIDLVKRLVMAKKRPVCSADIRAYLSNQDESEVGYIQPFGQILIKASVHRPGSTPRLYAIGIHKNRTYYATQETEQAHQQFARFCAFERAEYLLKRGYLLSLPKPELLKTDLDKAAAYSLRRIIEDAAPYLDGYASSKLRLWLDNRPREPWVKPSFHQFPREEALKILKEEVAARAPYIDTMNFNRHLARVCPTILRCGAEPVYCEELLRVYCETLWPTKNQNLECAVNSLLKWILVMVQVAVGAVNLEGFVSGEGRWAFSGPYCRVGVAVSTLNPKRRLRKRPNWVLLGKNFGFSRDS